MYFSSVLLLIQLTTCLADTLLQVQVLWRHGARNPISCNWNCEYFLENDLLTGYLTSTGMRQHFVLGQWMKERYINQYKLLNEKLDNEVIYVYSTNVNRTILSALSNMQGMFSNNGPNIPNIDDQYLLPPNKDAKMPTDIGNSAIKNNIQVVPVHTVEEITDIQLFPFFLCMKAYAFEIENLQSPLAQQIYAESTTLLNEFCDQMNIDPTYFSILNFSEYMDTLHASKYNNYLWPQNLKEDTYIKLDQLYSLQIALMIYQTWDQVQLLSSPFFEEMLNFSDQAVEFSKENIKYLKYVVYSGHDLNVQLIAAALNFTSTECMAQVFMKQKVSNENCIYTYPGYASNIIFELWREDTTMLEYVKILYNGTEMNICNKKETKCSYKQFKELILNQRKDFLQECYVEEDDIIIQKVPQWMKVITIIFFILVVCLFIIGIFLCRKLKKTSQEQQFGKFQDAAEKNA